MAQKKHMQTDTPLIYLSGNFWNTSLSDAGKNYATAITKTVNNRSTVISQEILDKINGEYWADIKDYVVHYTRGDIEPVYDIGWYQVRLSNGSIPDVVIDNATEISTNTDPTTPLATQQNTAILLPGAEEAEVVDRSQKAWWSLHFSDEIYVRTIRLSSGKLLHADTDFISQMGSIIIQDYPSSIFSNNRFVVESGSRQCRSIFSHLLDLDNVYGSSYYVTHYLQEIQTFNTLYTAAAQYAGMFVSGKNGHIAKREDVGEYTLLSIMYDGKSHDRVLRYLVPDKYKEGYELKENEIIAPEAFSYYKHSYELPSYFKTISLDQLLPVQGLRVSSKVIQIFDPITRAYRPKYEGTEEAQQAYLAWLNNLPPVYAPEVVRLNLGGTYFIMDVLLKNKIAIYVIDPFILGRKIADRLKKFLTLNKPVGSIILIYEANTKGNTLL